MFPQLINLIMNSVRGIRAIQPRRVLNKQLGLHRHVNNYVRYSEETLSKNENEIEGRI